MKFGFCLGIMYVEQELLKDIGILCEIGLVLKSRDDIGSYQSLGATSFKAIGLSKLEMDLPIMLLTN